MTFEADLAVVESPSGAIYPFIGHPLEFIQAGFREEEDGRIHAEPSAVRMVWEDHHKYKMSSLHAYLEWFIRHPAYLYLEVKPTEGGCPVEIYQAIQQTNLRDRVTIISFAHRELSMATGLGLHTGILGGDAPDPIEFRALLRHYNARVYLPEWSRLLQDVVDVALQEDVRIAPYVVNDIGIAHRMVRKGVDQLVTDRPDELMGIK